jgi:hypothetical protein
MRTVASSSAEPSRSFVEGTEWWEAIANMPAERLRLLMTTYDAGVCRHEAFLEAFGIL